MSDVAQIVLAQTLEFERQLPELLLELSGRWVVFRDGAVVSDHDTLEMAYRSARLLFGVDGGYAILEVAPRTPQPLTARAVFGLL